MRVEGGVRDEEFQEWLKRTEHGFVYMIRTMIDVARVIQENTLPLTPFRTGKLGRSFRWHIVTDNSRMKVVQLQMTALNPKDGYDYAMIQHENTRYRHPAKDSPHSYLDIAVRNIHHDVGRTNNPQSHYLRDGIRRSEEDALILIEEDYLSLFNRGFIF